MNNHEKCRHLFARAGFGISLNDWMHDITPNDAIKQLSNIDAITPLQVVSDEEWLANSPKAVKTMKEQQMDGEEVKMKEREFRRKTNDLNALWLQEMVKTSSPFREKMALFWHGHFASRSDNPYFDQLLLHELRTHCLGHFGDLLIAVSHSPSVLKFLNNQQNKKKHPNENFAREVMELFTLGRGNYTEDDIKEAARAFTGWAYDDNGQFVFHDKQHDAGSKTFLGKTGDFNGDDILKIILEQKQVAIFITQKVYRFFVNEEQPNDQCIASLADDFYKSNYDIANLMHNIFTASWFYDKEQIGARIKSPVELLVGMQRLVPLVFEEDKTLLNLQKVLGQQLFYPPNVAGWPGGRAWIDSSSLVIRLSLAEAMFGSKELDLHAKEQDAEMDMKHKIVDGAVQKDVRFHVKKVKADWSYFTDGWKQVNVEKMPQEMATFLLPSSLSKDTLTQVLHYADRSTPDHYIQSLAILLMSLPEYQLC